MQPDTGRAADTRFWKRLPGRAETSAVATAGLALTIFGAAFFSLFPSLDLAVSRAFYTAESGFALTHSPFAAMLRAAFLDFYPALYFLIAGSGLVSWRFATPVLRLEAGHWAFLAASSFAGPLVVANFWLKEHSGRVRPRDIADFGGAGSYTAPLDWSGACPDNCSFISGEVSSMTMAFIGLALVTSLWRPVFYAMAVAFGAAVAIIRVGQGGHFLSDSLAAMGIMTLIAAALYASMFLRRT